jgi:hypothetical protein
MIGAQPFFNNTRNTLQSHKFNRVFIRWRLELYFSVALALNPLPLKYSELLALGNSFLHLAKALT